MRIVRTPMLRKTAAAKLPVKLSPKQISNRLPRAPASGMTDRDGYTAVTGDDVDDLALLPRRFDHFAAEVRQSFEILANQILPKLDAIAAKQTEQGEDIAALKVRMAAVEKHVFKRKPRKRK